MKIFVVFGAQSDEPLYAPLIAELKKHHQVTWGVLSAHRHPEELQAALQKVDYDLVVAGAGLSAHLPGVIASQIVAPVIGIPVKAAFGGLDALCSIWQMPYGIPVISTLSEGFPQLYSILQLLDQKKQISSPSTMPTITFVSGDWSRLQDDKEVMRLEELAMSLNWPWRKSEKADPQGFNVIMVRKEEDIITTSSASTTSDGQQVNIHVPWLSSQEKNDPKSLLKILSWFEKGGLWVGTNNLRNGFLAMGQLLLRGSSHLEKIRSLRKSSAGFINEEESEMKEVKEILYQGSVKNVRGTLGDEYYYFEYSDRYSVFDWGEMPDHLKGKGESLAEITDVLFDTLGRKETWQNWPEGKNYLTAFPQLHPLPLIYQELCQKGMLHHSQGLRENGKGARFLKVKAVKVEKPREIKSQTVGHENSSGQHRGWNYEFYQQALVEKKTGFLVPLEVIFRLGNAKGSSLGKRAINAEYRQEIGLEGMPYEGQLFSRPIIEFSTKLEPADRYISYSEAQKIAGLSDDELSKLKALSTLTAFRLRDLLQKLGYELWDGKLEFALVSSPNGLREFMLVDALGPDEMRVIKDGEQLSKEALRQHYLTTAWYEAVEKAKTEAKEKGITDWQSICETQPPQLPSELKEQVEGIYQNLARNLKTNLSSSLESRSGQCR